MIYQTKYLLKQKHGLGIVNTSIVLYFIWIIVTATHPCWGVSTNQGWLLSRVVQDWYFMMPSTKTKTVAQKTLYIQVIEIQHVWSISNHTAVHVEPITSQGCLPSWFYPKWAFATCNHDHTHLINSAMCAANISFTKLQVWLLFEGGYYLGCGFYSLTFNSLFGVDGGGRERNGMLAAMHAQSANTSYPIRPNVECFVQL